MFTRLRAWWRRRRQGFTQRDIWNLDCTIARFVLPRLREFCRTIDCHPPDIDFETWERELETIVKAFEVLTENSLVRRMKEREDVAEGLRLFAKRYRYFWF